MTVTENMNPASRIFGSRQFVFFVVGVLSAFVFIGIYGVYVLDPTYVDWLRGSDGDLTQHYLGWVAYRESDWHFPIGMIDNLCYPSLVSVIYTDSIPCFAVVFKILSPILPDTFQYFGIWGILCFVFSGIISARILAELTDNKIVVVAGALLCVFSPVMFHRMFAHTALAGHWIVLLALEPLILRRKFNSPKKIFFRMVLLGVISIGVHAYFTLICGIVILFTCILDVLCEKRIKRSLLMLAAFLGSAIFTMYMFGGLSSGANVEGSGLGVYGLNLNALYNPKGWSSIFAPLPLYYGSQDFGYLGAGAILLVIIVAAAFLVERVCMARRAKCGYDRALTGTGTEVLRHKGGVL